MKPNSSQAAQTIAALKAFGLLETQRGDVGRALVISNDGRTYLRAQQDSIKQDVLRRAGSMPKANQDVLAGLGIRSTGRRGLPRSIGPPRRIFTRWR